MNNSKDILKKVTDIVTIVCPALISVFSVLDLTPAVTFSENFYKIFIAIIGALSSAASITYNSVATEEKENQPMINENLELSK